MPHSPQPTAQAGRGEPNRGGTRAGTGAGSLRGRGRGKLSDATNSARGDLCLLWAPLRCGLGARVIVPPPLMGAADRVPASRSVLADAVRTPQSRAGARLRANGRILRRAAAVGTSACCVGRLAGERRGPGAAASSVGWVSGPRACLHSLPDLPYDYGALEPHINAQIMQLHHSKHHAAYVNNLNATEEKYREALAKGDVTTQVALQPALKFNGGGHINHSIFWTNLSPKGGGEPKGELLEAIKRDFGSFEKFKEKLTAVSAGVQGSGWGWLGFNKEQGRLQIAACSNQDPLQGTTGLIPLLGIDVWEHAYYLQYKNVRPDYLKAIWNVINWENVTERFTACKK
ncbi:superoxide dismutase 2 mitochondrial [Cricetulus griseus]